MFPYTEKFVFTVTAGRSGQNSLMDLLQKHVPEAVVAFEEPSPKRIYTQKISGFLGGLENRFRRKFIETHELLGRGKVLKAFDEGDEVYLDAIVKKRLALIQKENPKIYIDVSKYFARGLHGRFARAVGKFSLILLVRDPLQNMRSFLNRNKNFTLDNNLPDAKSNILQMASSGMHKGELYLWAWSEMYLRYLHLIEEFQVQEFTKINTSDLDDPEKMNYHLDCLGLPHTPCQSYPKMNTNKEETVVSAEDRKILENFRKKLPSWVFNKIPELL